MSKQQSKHILITQSVLHLNASKAYQILRTTCYLQSICSYLSLTSNINSVMLLSKYHCNFYNDPANTKMIQLIVSYDFGDIFNKFDIKLKYQAADDENLSARQTNIISQIKPIYTDINYLEEKSKVILYPIFSTMYQESDSNDPNDERPVAPKSNYGNAMKLFSVLFILERISGIRWWLCRWKTMKRDNYKDFNVFLQLR